jgi:hypothetical protein
MKSRSRRSLDDVSWLTGRVHIPPAFTSFQTFALPTELTSSMPGTSPNEVCAPTPPEIQFYRKKNKLSVRENPTQAAAYELALKNRPDIFQVQLWNATTSEQSSAASSSSSSSCDQLRVGVNVYALGFQTIMQLPSHLPRTLLEVQWRVVPHNGGLVDGQISTLPKLTLTSCREEAPAPQPPHVRGRWLLVDSCGLLVDSCGLWVVG